MSDKINIEDYRVSHYYGSQTRIDWRKYAKALEKQVEGCLAKCRDEANRLLIGVPTPISPDDFDKLIDDMRQIGK